MATNYNIDPLKSMVLTGSIYKNIASNQAMIDNLQNRLTSITANIQKLETDLRNLQVQVLASLTPPVVVQNSTPITMHVNNDGTVTLTVG